MQLYEKKTTERHPFVQLIFLSLLVAGIFFVFSIFALIVVVFMGEISLSQAIVNQSNDINAIKIFLFVQQLSLFLIPALLLGVTEGKKPKQFYSLEMPSLSKMVIVFWLMLSSLPFISKISELNQQIVLPAFLKNVENLIQQTEKSNQELTLKLLTMKNIGAFISSFIVMVITPAVCEEFLFRGAIQRTLKRWFANPHSAIWLTATIFSAIHFQFYEFFTRLFLGAGLGYIYFYTGSLWCAIFGHFLNNATVVVFVYYLQLKGKSITEDVEYQTGWIGFLVSTLLIFVLFKILKDRAAKKKS